MAERVVRSACCNAYVTETTEPEAIYHYKCLKCNRQCMILHDVPKEKKDEKKA